MSLSARRAWIEIGTYSSDGLGPQGSLSARRAWIEMSPLMWPWSPLNVALRKESVDRNFRYLGIETDPLESLSARRAWIEITHIYFFGGAQKSLSARRAWIEMEDDGILSTGAPVALRKESVDRNITNELLTALKTMSLSARRAWIEIGKEVQ